MCVSVLRFTRSLLSLHRFSILLILPVLRSGNAYANSEGYAPPGKSYHSRSYFRVLSRSPVGLSSLGVLVTTMKGR